MAVTMRDVAVAAGVSIKTVSNVINDYPFIKPATRDRVLRAIDELGYRPNLSARNLSRGRTGLIALALPEIDAPYFAEMARLVIAAAAEHSWTVLIEQTDGLRSRELMALQGVRTHLVDGVILSPLALGPAELADAGTAPVVLLGERVSAIQLDHVAIDNVAASEEAVRHLADDGRRIIAAIGAQTEVSAQTAHQRLAGYRRALERAGLPYRSELVRPAHEWHRHSGAEATRELLRLAQPPDAIFCFNDLLALGALRALYEARIDVPGGIAVVGFDDIEDGRFATPSLTTVAPDKPYIARTSIELLATRLRRYPPPPPPQEVTAGHRLIVRESSSDQLASERSMANSLGPDE
jgi:DNA-binding LacI/PurR family transcriptional regulator